MMMIQMLCAALLAAATSPAVVPAPQEMKVNEGTYSLKAETLEKFTDVIVTSANFAWTYCKTHESDIGPYFYRPKKKNNI